MVCLGYSFFSVADTIAKSLRVDYSVNHVLAYSSGIAWLLTTIYIYFKYGFRGFIPKSLKLQLWRAAVLSGSSRLVTTALGSVPLAEFYGVAFISPFVVTLLAFFFLKEKIKKYQIISIIAGFSGVLILIAPELTGVHKALLLVVASTTLFSINLLIIRKIGPGENKLLYPFYAFAGIFVTSFPFTLHEDHTMSIEDMATFIVYGSILVMAQIALARGFALAPSTGVVAPFHYIQMLWGIVLGFLIFGDIPTWTTILGASIIIGSGLYMIFHERRPKAIALIEDTTKPL